MRVLLVLPFVLALSGCCRDPWSAYPMPAAPDGSCSLGGAHAGWDVYVWECTGGKRVVVAQYSAEMTCSSPIRETAPCGGTTSFEREHAQELKSDAGTCKRGARPGREWQAR